MRIALIAPYSWTYPGGVTRHIEALADHVGAAGHDVSVLAPYDPDDRLSARLHGGARPEVRPVPDYLIPLGRTVGVPLNGSSSNLGVGLNNIPLVRRALDAGDFDVVHLHEPMATWGGWDTLGYARAPLVGTFHCYSENVLTNNLANLAGARRRMNRLRMRIAVSQAAAWTGRRFFGGSYRLIPNGVDLEEPPPLPVLGDRDELSIAFIGQAVERKGLPILLRAFEALREQVPASLTIVGADESEVAPLVLDPRGITVLGPVSDERKQRCLAEADVLCAPSLGGESFGMVLTEAFAAGTPVVASDIAGYRDVVRPGTDGVLVPRGDPTALAEALRDLWYEPRRRQALAEGAGQRARRFAWPRVAGEVLDAYEAAIATPDPVGRTARAATRLGLMPSESGPRVKARRLPSMEPALPGARHRAVAIARRLAMAAAAVVGLALAALALERIGVDSIVVSLLRSSPIWVLVGLGLMCASMALRAVAWHAILRAALPQARVRLLDAAQGTFIGVLMSATLPARLGEPSRAFVVARRLGRVRERFPVVLGTLASQTLLNIVALVILGGVMVSTVGLLAGRERALLLWAIAPIFLICAVVVAPALLRGSRAMRSARLHRWGAQARAALVEVRRGLRVFRQPHLGGMATIAQLLAWAVQWLSCYVLLVALGLDERAGLGAAAAVLFAVNVTAVLPATPSNLGLFQAACMAVLSAGYGISAADALGYGIVLQAVEIATAAIMGMPALVKEGLSWRDVRMRALHTAPVHLGAHDARDTVEAEA